MVPVSDIRKYHNAPLVLAILQVVHPAAPPLTRGEEAALKQALIRTLPLITQESVNQIELTAGPGGAQPATRMVSEPLVRFSSRDKRTSVSFGPNSITLETTKYDTWDQLRELTMTILTARMDIAPVDGVERIGLRYIDELRIPDDPAPVWPRWVDPKLTAPVLDGVSSALQARQQQATVQYATAEPEVLVTLRYGATVGPSSLSATLPLAHPSVPEVGPFFLIDTDASWTPRPGDEVPILDPAAVLTKADTLHGYVKALFEASLTDRLRTEVLNAE